METLKELKVETLLDIYDPDKEIKNFEYLFADDYTNRTDDYANDIVRVAAVYNVETSIKSLMYDCGEQNKYYSNSGYIFSDISKVECAPYSTDEYNHIFQVMNEVGFFNWRNVIEAEDTTDGLYFEVVIEYSDGSFFKVKLINDIGDINIEDYNKLLDVLFNG